MREEIVNPSGREPAGREPFLTAGQVAKQLGMSAKWVYAHANGARKPLLLSYKFGSAVRFKQSDIDDFVERLKRAQQPWTIQ